MLLRVSGRSVPGSGYLLRKNNIGFWKMRIIGIVTKKGTKWYFEQCILPVLHKEL